MVLIARLSERADGDVIDAHFDDILKTNPRPSIGKNKKCWRIGALNQDRPGE